MRYFMNHTSQHNPTHFIEVSASDRAAIVDALYRFGAGQDLRDHALFESAFAPHASLDFTQPADVLGAKIPVFEGRDVISHTIMTATAQLATTHTVTNPRITMFDGERAQLFALVEAQHVPKNDRSRHLLLKNIYTVELSKHNREWLIERMVIENVWFHGEPSVLF